MAALWHYRGIPDFTSRQAMRLGSAQRLAAEANHNKQIHRISVLVNQLAGRYHAARKEDGRPVFGTLELQAIRDVLSAAEKELETLYILAGASTALLAEAYDAFDMDAPDRPFELLAASDDGRAAIDLPPYEA
jgi:hypothetical protein